MYRYVYDIYLIIYVCMHEYMRTCICLGVCARASYKRPALHTSTHAHTFKYKLCTARIQQRRNVVLPNVHELVERLRRGRHTERRKFLHGNNAHTAVEHPTLLLDGNPRFAIWVHNHNKCCVCRYMW